MKLGDEGKLGEELKLKLYPISTDRAVVSNLAILCKSCTKKTVVLGWKNKLKGEVCLFICVKIPEAAVCNVHSVDRHSYLLCCSHIILPVLSEIKLSCVR